VPASWVPLVALGVVVALAVQAGRAHLSTGAALAVSLTASVAGVAGAAGARAWYVALHRGKVPGVPTQGLCIQGFIVAAVVVLVAGLALAGMPAGTFLDVSAPGVVLRHGHWPAGVLPARLLRRAADVLAVVHLGLRRPCRRPPGAHPAA